MAHPVINLSNTERSLLFEQIVKALETMPDDLRTVFVASHYEGKTPQESETELGLSEGSLRILLRKANQHFFRTMRRPQA